MRYVQVGRGYRFRSVRTVLDEMPDMECLGVVGRSGRAGDSTRFFTDVVSCLGEVTPDVVMCFSPTRVVEVMEACVRRGVPVVIQPSDLVELDSEAVGGVDSGLVQVGQYQLFSPGYLARRAVIDLGEIGEVTQVHISAPSWTSMALIRAYLGVSDEEVVVSTHRFEEGMVLVSLDFPGGRQGIYEYACHGTRRRTTGRLLIRGTMGEISGDQVVRQTEDLITTRYLVRGPGGITLGDRTLWTNPHPAMGWSESEQSVVHFLAAISEWISGGSPPHPLKEGLLDVRLTQA